MSNLHHQTLNDQPYPDGYQRDVNFWIEDGNIVLIAHGTDGSSETGHATMFKVHRGLLARQSVVFRDHLIPSALRCTAEEVEGCPVIHLAEFPSIVSLLLSGLLDLK